MRVKKFLWSTVLAVSLFLRTATSSEAFTINTIGTSNGNPGGLPVYNVTGLVQGDTFDIIWDYDTQGQTLSAEATINIVSLTTNSAQVSIDLENTSTIGRITSFGLSVGNFTSLGTGTVGSDLTKFKTSNFPGFQSVDACATSGNNCAGGQNGGIVVGDSDSFTFALNGTFGNPTPTLTLDSFAIKVQSGPNGASFELPGTPGDPGTSTPEPGSLLLLGSGLTGLGFLVRRKKAQ